MDALLQVIGAVIGLTLGVVLIVTGVQKRWIDPFLDKTLGRWL